MTDAGSVLIRTVADPAIGFGHLRRCLTLAGAVEELGMRASFLVAAPPLLLDRVTAAGFEVTAASEGDVAETLERAAKTSARVVVTDDYALTEEFHAALARTLRVVVVDDLADRVLPVHIVVNGSAGAERLTYRGGPATRHLLGPQYMLLRPEFGAWSGRTTQDRVRRVLVTTGGGDVHGLAPRLARWAVETLVDVDVDVILGPMVAATADGAAWPKRTTLHRDPADVRSLMRAADLALCAGGQTLYELAATGTPAVAVQVADNQAQNLGALAEAGAVVVAGEARDAALPERVTTALAELARDPGRRATMTERGRQMVDGQGAARVAHAITELIDPA